MIEPVISESPKKRPTVLLVDDEAGPRDALKVILRPFYDIRSAGSAAAAMHVLNSQPIDLITLDQRLPDCRGLDLLQEIKHHSPGVEVIIITGYGSVTSAMEGVRHGAAGYLLKPFNITELLALVNQTLERKARIDFLRCFIKTSTKLWGTEAERPQAWKQLLAEYHAIGTPTSGHMADSETPSDYLPLLSDLLEAKDRNLLNHCSRVSLYATLLANRIHHLTAAEQKSLALGAFLHDIGEVGPETYRFAVNEIDVSGRPVGHQQHLDQGLKLVVPLGLPAEVRQIIAYHHERWDGSGFPYGLQEQDIPYPARIVSLAERFDHLTADCPDRTSLSIDRACQEMLLQSGTHFEPKLTELFVHVIEECKASLSGLATVTCPTDQIDS